MGHSCSGPAVYFNHWKRSLTSFGPGRSSFNQTGSLSPDGAFGHIVRSCLRSVRPRGTVILPLCCHLMVLEQPFRGWACCSSGEPDAGVANGKSLRGNHISAVFLRPSGTLYFINHRLQLLWIRKTNYPAKASSAVRIAGSRKYRSSISGGFLLTIRYPASPSSLDHSAHLFVTVSPNPGSEKGLKKTGRKRKKGPHHF